MKNNYFFTTSSQLYLLKQIKMRSHIGIPILAYIKGEFPELMTFEVDNEQMRTIEFYIENGRYDVLMDLYSSNFVRAILSFFEAEEEFEECEYIVNKINERNRIMKLNVPTSPYQQIFSLKN